MDNLIELLNVFGSDKTAFLFNYIIQITRSNSNRKGTGYISRKSTVLLSNKEKKILSEVENTSTERLTSVRGWNNTHVTSQINL
jgi:hypothetical protein